MKRTKKAIIIIVVSLAIASISWVIMSTKVLFLRQTGLPMHNKLNVLGGQICAYQRSFFYTHGRYAVSVYELDPSFNPSNEEFMKEYGNVEIYFSEDEFDMKYPNLLKCTHVGVEQNKYTILIVGNLDMDDLPHITIVQDGCIVHTLISDEYNNFLEKCL